MRLLLVSDLFPPVKGGLEFHVDGLASELARTGHEVHVATLTRDPSPSGPGVTVHTVPASARLLPHAERDRPFTAPVTDPLARHSLGRLVHELRPDVVHGHSWLATSTPRGRRGPPLVFTVHDYGLLCELRTLLHASGEACDGPALGKCFRCAAAVNGVVRAVPMGMATTVGRRLLRPDLVIAVSRYVADTVQPYLNDQVRVIPNFYSDVAPVRPPGLPDRFVLYAGSPGDHKGIRELVRVWSVDPPDVPLLLAVTQRYDGPLPETVHVQQWSRAEVRGALALAEIAVIPSRWHDPCPTIALEALATGTPILATNVGGLKEIVRDGVNGRLIAPGSSAMLAHEVRRLLDDAPTRLLMAAAARERAADFSAATVTTQLVRAYQDVQERRLGQRPA